MNRSQRHRWDSSGQSRVVQTVWAAQLFPKIQVSALSVLLKPPEDSNVSVPVWDTPPFAFCLFYILNLPGAYLKKEKKNKFKKHKWFMQLKQTSATCSTPPPPPSKLLFLWCGQIWVILWSLRVTHFVYECSSHTQFLLAFCWCCSVTGATMVTWAVVGLSMPKNCGFCSSVWYWGLVQDH